MAARTLLDGRDLGAVEQVLSSQLTNQRQLVALDQGQDGLWIDVRSVRGFLRRPQLVRRVIRVLRGWTETERSHAARCPARASVVATSSPYGGAGGGAGPASGGRSWGELSAEFEAERERKRKMDYVEELRRELDEKKRREQDHGYSADTA